MANLQIKGIDDNLYGQIKALAASENRSISQQVLFLVKNYLLKRHQLQNTKPRPGSAGAFCLLGGRQVTRANCQGTEKWPQRLPKTCKGFLMYRRPKARQLDSLSRIAATAE